MDLERLKQTLRLRSGRTKKTRKPPPNPPASLQKPPRPPSTVQNGSPIAPKQASPSESRKKEDQAPLDRQDSVPRQKKPIEGLPSLYSAPSNQPEPPIASTNLAWDREEPRSPTSPFPGQYGDSGVELPQRPLPPSVTERRRTELKAMSSDETDMNDFDLRPRPRKPKPPSIEKLCELLLSESYLNTIVHDPQLLLRLNIFLSRYKPHLSPLLIRYLETQKAIKAVEYANAVAEAVTPFSSEEYTDEGAAARPPSTAAQVDQAFVESSKSIFSSLLSEGLPAYVTYQLIKIVTDCLSNEITGRSTPIIRGLVGGLSEIFCLTDPNQEDNPIIYASEEFYRLTGYDTNDVIGNNCRFLQGPKTSQESPKRLREGQQKVEQVCETLLNYRRDGRAFINLLMIAPLFDDKGKLKYYIGAQVDVSGLIEGVKCLDGFNQFLVKRETEALNENKKRDKNGPDAKKKKALEKLKELSEMFDLEESAVVQTHSRSSSMTRGDDESINSKERPRTARRVIADSSHSDEEGSQGDGENEEDKSAWKLASSGPSGKLPGVYQSFLLIRPAPSLRIVFISPALRKLGNVMQSRFLTHVAAPSTTLKALKESFSSGVPVTAKVGFMAKAGKNRDGTTVDRSGKKAVNEEDDEDVKTARTCWISATPLLGGDDEVGVWMVVMVQKSGGTSSTPTANRKADSKDTLPQMPAVSRNTTELNSNLPSTSTRPLRSGARKEHIPIKTKSSSGINGTGHQSLPAPESSSHDSQPVAVIEDQVRNDDTPKRIPTLSSPKATKTTRSSPNHVDLGNGGDDGDDNDDDLFVQRRESRSSAQPSERIVIQPDSDDEDQLEEPSNEDPNSIPPSPPIDLDEADHSDHDQDTVTDSSPIAVSAATHQENGTAEMRSDWENTPTKDQSVSEPDSSSRPSTSQGPESNSKRPSGVLYMDYLRHPGSGPQVTASGRANSMGSEDVDCSRSPYSVD